MFFILYGESLLKHVIIQYECYIYVENNKTIGDL